MDDRLATLTEKRIDDGGIVDAMRFLSCSRYSGGGPEVAAKHLVDRWPNAVSAPWLTKAVAPATTLDPAWAGALLPPALRGPLERRMQQAAITGRIPGLVRAPVGVPVPTETAALGPLDWVNQTAPKPVTRMTLASVTLQPSKIAGIVVLADELTRLTTGGAEQVMANALIAASTRGVDRKFLDPAIAGTASHPPSITNGATLVPSTGPVGPTDLANLVAAFYGQRPDAVAPVFIASPATATVLAASGAHADVRVSGGTLLGVPLVTTAGAGNVLALIDAAGVVVSDDGAAIDLSKHAAVELEASPSSPPTGATVLVDLWSRNLLGVKIDRHISWAREATAVAYMVLS